MPRFVDREDRRQAIARATVELIGSDGLRRFSFRALAESLGGSVTLVTHYYPTQQALFDDLASQLIEGWRNDLERLEEGIDDPNVRLRAFLEWLLPLSEEALLEERARINLLSDRIFDGNTKPSSASVDAAIRGFLRERLEAVIPADRLESTLELVRAITNGITLAVIEEPAAWPRERQLAVLGDAISLLGLEGRPAREGLSSART